MWVYPSLSIHGQNLPRAIRVFNDARAMIVLHEIANVHEHVTAVPPDTRIVNVPVDASLQE